MSFDIARLTTALARPRTPYAILRPEVVHDMPGVSAWLRRHVDGGWLQSDQEDRDTVARRLIWTVWRLYGRPVDAATLHAEIAGVDALAQEARHGL